MFTKNNVVNKQYQLLKSRLLLESAEEDDKVLVFTSAKSSEGVTSVALGFSQYIELDETFDILLVDCSAEPGTLYQRLANAEFDGASLSHSELDQEGDLNWENHIKKIPNSQIHILTIDSNKVLRSDIWQTKFSELKRQYQYIIVDAGSLETETPMLWSGWTRRIILIIDSSRTTIHDLKNLQSKIKSHNIELFASVLNKKKFYIPEFIYKYLY